jgi:hypothetical protein
VSRRLACVHDMFIISAYAVDDARVLQPGQLLQRGVSRHLASYGCLWRELVPARGSCVQVDVMALGTQGRDPRFE